MIGTSAALDRLFRRTSIATLTLAFLTLFVPLTTLELALRPFTKKLGKETSLFVRDAELGWKLKANATQEWGGVTVTTNGRGMRGPEIPYEKAAGTTRILYLGDSVSFGYMVKRWQDTFPHRIEELLETPSGAIVETISSGVGGYSCWQQLAFLRDEGLRYDPDVVVIDFVLNDVTEKFTLVRYGGYEESRQLRESYYSRLDVLLARSALVFQVRNLTREWKAKRVLGSDPYLGAIKKEIFDVKSLWQQPEATHIVAAWEITLESLQGIFDICREQDIKVLLVIHPFTDQFTTPEESSAPQQRLGSFAREQGIPTIDLLPILHRHLDGTNQFPDVLFLDHDHLSVEGHKVVARILADSLRTMIDHHSGE
jgi:lysophospholipase L1-like esterase